MDNLPLKKWHKIKCCIYLFVLMVSTPVFAALEPKLPFDSTLKVLKNAITGPFLMAAAMIMVVVTCIMLAFGEWGDGFKKLINVGLWLSIAFGATSFINILFPSSIAIR